MAIKRIGVLTSGGDCGGLNGVIRGVAFMANSLGIEPIMIPNGYAGLYNLIDMDEKEIVVLNQDRLDDFTAYNAGSEAGHSRVKISKIKNPDKYKRIKEGLQKFNIDGLIISGGDDTGSVVVDLADNGIPCIHAPKTMDLDLQCYSVGGDSTVGKIADYLHEIKTTGKTHSRIIVMEVFGRYVGHTAFRGGIAADADCILIPEIPVDMDIVYEHMKKVFTKRCKNSDVHTACYTIVVSEGLKDASGENIYDETSTPDAFGHKKLAGAGRYVKQQLEKRMKADLEMEKFMKETHMYVEGIYERPEIREVTPGHLVRCGKSSPIDVNFGKEVGAGAVKLLLQGISGVTVCRLKGSEILYMKTKEAIEQRYVNLNSVSLYETQNICFGRKPKAYEATCLEVSHDLDRTYF